MDVTFFIKQMLIVGYGYLHLLHGMGHKLWGYAANVSAEKQEEGVKYVSCTFEFVRLEYTCVYI